MRGLLIKEAWEDLRPAASSLPKSFVWLQHQRQGIIYAQCLDAPTLKTA